MAERMGFEPTRHVSTPTPLAGERLQPLGHLSVNFAPRLEFVLRQDAACFFAYGFRPLLDASLPFDGCFDRLGISFCGF